MPVPILVKFKKSIEHDIVDGLLIAPGQVKGLHSPCHHNHDRDPIEITHIIVVDSLSTGPALDHLRHFTENDQALFFI